MSLRQILLRLVLLGALIAALCVVSLSWFSESSVVVSFWPANALALAFVLRAFSRPLERGLAVLVSFLVMTGVSLVFGRDSIVGLGFAAANAVEIAVAALVLRRSPMPLADGRTLWRLVLGAVIAGPLASSLVAGAAIGIERGWGGAVFGGGQWLAADALGMAVFAPLFLAARLAPLPKAVRTRGLVRTIGALAAVAVVTAGAFTQDQFPALFAIFPLVVLSVWAGRTIGGACAVALVAAIAALMTSQGLGPLFVAATSTTAEVFGVQAFIAAQILTVHPLALALSRLDAYAADEKARRREAERRSDTRAKLLAHVSHEIRSPLSGVMGLAELMRNGALGELSPPQKDGVARIADCAVEMQALASDLLDAAAVQSGRLSVSLAPVGVRSAVEGAVEAARFRLREYAPEISYAGAWRDDLAIRADPQRLKQVLINLVVNAAKYGGRPPRIEIAASQSSGRIRIEVSDNGAGVPDALRAKLFTPFERLGAEKSGLEGSGVGLAVARELVELQGGAIGVEDSPLGGARFFVEFERADAAAAAA